MTPGGAWPPAPIATDVFARVAPTQKTGNMVRALQAHGRRGGP